MMKNGPNLRKIWYRFSNTGSLGNKGFRYEKLQEDRFEEFMDFKMKFFVNNEISHTVTGIHKNPEALKEYRNIVSTLYKKPNYEVTLCCLDDGEKNDIVSFSLFNLYKKGDDYNTDAEANTKEVKDFLRILHEWNSVCHVPDILTKYGVDTFVEYLGTAIDPKYTGYGILKEADRLRHQHCKEYGASMCGAWMTALATQVSAERVGWQTICTISSEELGKKLGITFNVDAPPSFKYMIQRV